MAISREVKTGVLVVAALLLILFTFNYLKGEKLFSNENLYYTEFEYNALNPSSPVTIKGNSVGKVDKIKYDFETGKTRVSFRVDPQLKVSKNSIIRLYETGIMGGNALAIIEAGDNDYAKSGDYLKSEVQPGLISSLSENFSGLSTDLDKTLLSADSLLISLNNLVQDDSEDGIKSAIGELNSTLKSFKGLSYSMQSLVKKNDQKLTEMIDNFSTTSENLSALSEDIKKVEISKTITNLDQTLNSLNTVLAEVKNGNGTLGKLIKDDKLYTNLEGATKEMKELLEDIKLHPKRYFRILSKKEIPYKEK